MAGLTRSNIAYDLNVSPHDYKIVYGDDVLHFMFSSELYKNNFIKKLEEHRTKINRSLSNRFGFTIRNDRLADIKLYLTIEKRGFLIYQNGIKMPCLNNLVLDGETLIVKI